MGNFISQDYLADFVNKDDSFVKFVAEINDLKAPANMEQYKYDVVKTIPSVYRGLVDEINGRIKTINREFELINVFNDDNDVFKNEFSALVKKYNLNSFQIVYFTTQLDLRLQHVKNFSGKISEELIKKYENDVAARRKLIEDIQAHTENEKIIKTHRANFKSIDNEIKKLESKNSKSKENTLESPLGNPIESSLPSLESVKNGQNDSKDSTTGMSSTPEVSVGSISEANTKKVTGGGRRPYRNSLSTLYMDYQ